MLEELVRALELRPAGPCRRRVARRGIVTVPPRGGRVLCAPRLN
jgi:hypothetical protein